MPAQVIDSNITSLNFTSQFCRGLQFELEPSFGAREKNLHKKRIGGHRHLLKFWGNGILLFREHPSSRVVTVAFGRFNDQPIYGAASDFSCVDENNKSNINKSLQYGLLFDFRVASRAEL
jgi:hypothetical protein